MALWGAVGATAAASFLAVAEEKSERLIAALMNTPDALLIGPEVGYWRNSPRAGTQDGRQGDRQT